ncbi:hypothetical protein CLV49_1883 [Labedella gwakjiensis]|uniref:Uncharacterized protein n=1 Tax=Labedella gwakjiensis TaxID=390269 RepID=A0A2P8GWD5_9MICO|nr:hypothetical protein [Labedella gwakjiensis]PSL38266.1 hypothetical protein CLV49_1883 [Labedella gwakjiensis]RUQ87196.1 hypothetical protein ELQ93_09805 [Labedella gwakjiensis]
MTRLAPSRSTRSRLDPPAASPPPPVVWSAARLHRPLLALAIASAVFAVVCVVGLVVDPREILGQPAWAKPLKFALSIALYAVTLAWMIGLASRARRLLSLLGGVVVVALLLEMVVIVGAVLSNTTSHFNVSTPLATAAWALMAVSIVVVWLVTVVVAVVLFRAPLGDPARSLAIRAGLVIGLIGMGLAFLMTSPTSEQLNDFQGVAGAHAVGVADGGAGLPLLGWSTEGGDLRVPHFIGMHALQALPLLVIGLELLAGRVPVLRLGAVRFRLVLTAAVGIAGLVAIVTWQALRGQSIVAPDTSTIAVTVGLVVAVVAGVVVSLARGAGRADSPDGGMPAAGTEAGVRR